jgi:hypothetical protein
VRTTVTLDEDVAERLKATARERGISFKAALNEAARSGLSQGRSASTAYRVDSRELELRPGIDLDKALRLAGELEDSELARKLELRK